MGKGFFISKPLGVVGIIMGVGAVSTIIGLAVVYSQEKAKNLDTTPSTTTTTSTAVPPTTGPGNEQWHKYRLPDTLIPEYYEVTLQPFLTENAQGLYIFTGHSEVTVHCVKDTNLIIIHSNKLNLTKDATTGQLATLRAIDGSTPPAITKSWLEVRTQFLVAQLDGNLKAGQKYALRTVFTGELADDLGGFYRSVYTDDGVDK